ncbi:hypothetical protein [Sphingomonas sp. NIBR02145]|uniref:hypothetical protein n=2 Tax=unclassified Sphingomonas TaxID=196159 RepID=UPI0022B48B18|nr:hypothetical protein [Sphingomonas sp. NIBR02145]WHU04745.1 hypothetical protein O3305_09200 [Sphingomonas sp. NIBR02145]|eukprot:TRINITY_DN24550_c0_g1_i1.p3 TRINITY_DN24550_c0_g1~~TRINITY_DN24550_c0_g1_i1.p3  ORF type:complete len:112 (+),score=23.73 TRINITY_DN24550_c0_g1_i1:424-759(+)
MSCMPIPSQLSGSQAISGFDPFSSTLHTVVANEIREMRVKLEALAEVLVCDEHFAASYLEQLQDFDYLIQHADECVNLLERIAGGEDSLTAIGHIRLGAVQQRMRDALRSA